jgi:pyruvate kinase
MEFSQDPEQTIQEAIKRLINEERVDTGDQIVTVTNVLADGKVVESIQLREVDEMLKLADSKAK